jgi:hypothetical protein
MAVAVAVATLNGAPLLCAAQSSLPPITPTAQTVPTTEAVSVGSPAPAVHQAQVDYQMGELTVIAENSSLDAILRDIAQKTGMKITGGVTSQQVYGTYGPAAPAEVLASLLEGSGNNMILREDPSGRLIELVLAPLEGAPSSPLSSAQPQSSYAATPPYRPPPQFNPPQNPAPPRQEYVAPAQPVYTQPTEVTPPQDVTQSADTPSAQTSEPTSNVPQSPNGVPTPQQIFQELQQLQQRQKAAAPASTQ